MDPWDVIGRKMAFARQHNRKLHRKYQNLVAYLSMACYARENSPDFGYHFNELQKMERVIFGNTHISNQIADDFVYNRFLQSNKEYCECGEPMTGPIFCEDGHASIPPNIMHYLLSTTGTDMGMWGRKPSSRRSVRKR